MRFLKTLLNCLFAFMTLSAYPSEGGSRKVEKSRPCSSVLRKIDRILEKTSLDCAICLEEKNFEEEGLKIGFLPCEHLFCEDCLGSCEASQEADLKKCALCRGEYSIEERDILEASSYKKKRVKTLIEDCLKTFISKTKTPSAIEKKEVKALLTHKEDWIRSWSQGYWDSLFDEAICVVREAEYFETNWLCCGRSCFPESVVKTKRKEFYLSSEKIARIISFEFSNKMMREKALVRFEKLLEQRIFSSLLKFYQGDFLAKSQGGYSFSLTTWRNLLEELAHHFIEDKLSKVLSLNQLTESILTDKNDFSHRRVGNLTLLTEYLRKRRKSSLKKVDYIKFYKKYRKKEKRDRNQKQLITLLIKWIEDQKEIKSAWGRRAYSERGKFLSQLKFSFQVTLGLMTFGFDDEQEFLYEIDLKAIFILFLNIIEDSRFDYFLKRDIGSLLGIFWRNPITVDKRDEILKDFDVRNLPILYASSLEEIERDPKRSEKSREENLLEVFSSSFSLWR